MYENSILYSHFLFVLTRERNNMETNRTTRNTKWNDLGNHVEVNIRGFLICDAQIELRSKEKLKIAELCRCVIEYKNLSSLVLNKKWTYQYQ